METPQEENESYIGGLLFVLAVVVGLVVFSFITTASAQTYSNLLCGYNGNDCAPSTVSISQDRQHLAVTFGATAILYVSEEDGTFCDEIFLNDDILVAGIPACGPGYVKVFGYNDHFGTSQWVQQYFVKDGKLYYPDELFATTTPIDNSLASSTVTSLGSINFGLAIIVSLMFLAFVTYIYIRMSRKKSWQ